MAKKELSADDIEAMIERVSSSRKYAEANVPRETIRDLILQEAPLCKNPKETEKSMREKLHQIMAPYLGDPDYESEEVKLREAAAVGEESVRQWALNLLSVHSSTRERLPVMEDFYSAIFSSTGKPETILDCACAFDPFSFFWMGLPKTVKYHAFDLHQPRVRLINSFFRCLSMDPLAEVRDILLDPPTVKADMAFFFKEAHRFESRRKGCNRQFWKALPVEILVVTLPAENLTGQHQMRGRQRSLIEKNIEGLGWTYEEKEVSGEMVFIIQK